MTIQSNSPRHSWLSRRGSLWRLEDTVAAAWPRVLTRVLGRGGRRLAADWFGHYGYRPVLLETFVQRPRFRGTAYRAANWRCVGLTKGRGKREKRHQTLLPQKAIFLYPLRPDFKAILTR